MVILLVSRYDTIFKCSSSEGPKSIGLILYDAQKSKVECPRTDISLHGTGGRRFNTLFSSPIPKHYSLVVPLSSNPTTEAKIEVRL